MLGSLKIPALDGSFEPHKFHQGQAVGQAEESPGETRTATPARFLVAPPFTHPSGQDRKGRRKSQKAFAA